MSWRRTEWDPDEEHDIAVQRELDDECFAQEELLQQQGQETTQEICQ